MKSDGNGKIIIRLAAIVLVSLAIGGLLGFRFAIYVAKKKSSPEQWNIKAMHTLERRLKLTPEQTQRVQAEVDQAVDEMKVIRVDTIAKTADVIDRLIANVEKEMITPEQKAEFDIIKKERHDASLDLLKVEPRKKSPAPPDTVK